MAVQYWQLCAVSQKLRLDSVLLSSLEKKTALPNYRCGSELRSEMARKVG